MWKNQYQEPSAKVTPRAQALENLLLGSTATYLGVYEEEYF